jgi:hypothetical protein
MRHLVFVTLKQSSPKHVEKRNKHTKKIMHQVGFIYKIVVVVVVVVVSGSGSVVGVATGYGLDCPGIESRWKRDFSHLSRPALGPT